MRESDKNYLIGESGAERTAGLTGLLEYKILGCSLILLKNTV